jgi:hypothetical protein
LQASSPAYLPVGATNTEVTYHPRYRLQGSPIQHTNWQPWYPNEEPHVQNAPTPVESSGQILVSFCKQKEPDEKARIDRHLEAEYQKLMAIDRRHLELQALPIALPGPVQCGNTERRRPTASLTREGLLGPRLSY